MSISADEKKLNALTDTFTKTYTDIVEHLKSVLQKRLELELEFLGEGAVPMHYVDDDGNEIIDPCLRTANDGAIGI